MSDGPAKSSSESNGTILKREERMIPSDPDGLTREDPCPTLADNDLTGRNRLSTEELHTQSFSGSLFMLSGFAALFGFGHKY